MDLRCTLQKSFFQKSVFWREIAHPKVDQNDISLNGRGIWKSQGGITPLKILYIYSLILQLCWIQFQCIWEKNNFNYCSTLRSTILNRVQFKESGVPTSIKREGTTEKLCVLAKKIQVIKLVLRTHFLKSPFALRCMRYCILYACMLQYESCSFPRWLLLNW